jgi:hypothetical protein
MHLGQTVLEFFDFAARTSVVTVMVIFAGFCIVRYAVDYAFKAKQTYMSSMIEKATKVGASIDLGIQ